MTGFAHESLKVGIGTTLTWEIRTLNHRYLDVQFKLPNAFSSKEPDFRKQLSKKIKRGKVECSLHYQKTVDKKTDIQIDNSLVEILNARIAELPKEVSLAPISPIELLKWPGVIKRSEFDAEPLYKEADSLFSNALDSVTKMRLNEGMRITEILCTKCDEIEQIINMVRKRMPKVLGMSLEKQKNRLKKLNIEADPLRLEMELALISQKIDIDEEIDRIKSHVVEIQDTIQNKSNIGRRLDFLMQELNREANTLGSKSADTKTTQASINLKVIIEKMREQIQNVE
jgi:uncharacterized protein (TIGR00255 family)